MRVSIASVLACCQIANAASTFSPARPPSIPLAVKSPYLSTWQAAGQNGGNGGYLAGQWPSFWHGNSTGWTGLIKVDGTPYVWMGAPGLTDVALVNQTAFTYTATSSIFDLQAGNVSIKVTFLSPVYPDDLKRQSLVFSYLNVEISSTDDAEHSVQLYSDISAEWISGTHTNIAQWEYGSTSAGNNYHKVYRQIQQEFSETFDQAEWGNWYYGTSNDTGVSHQSGADIDVRNQFLKNGNLTNTSDTNFRAINDNFPAFGFAKDLGNVNGTASVLFSIGLCQQNAIQFNGAQGNVSVPSLWTSYFGSDTDALDSFHGDFPSAESTSATLDAKVASDSKTAGGDDYSTITSLALRQSFAGTQLTNTQDEPLMFLKEISSDGNVNTVDVIYPTHSVFLYTNPALIKYLLNPLLINQASGHYPNQYSMHDLGSSYPNATGHEDGKDEYMPLEECGNMIIMMLAYHQKTQDTDWLKQYYNLTKIWTGYLIDEALIPAAQVSTDDFAGSLENQTNLALKGIIGIAASAQIANLTGHTDDASNFSNTASNYIEQWYNLSDAQGANPPHTTLNYGNASSWGLLYNLYADTLLGLNLVKEDIYTQQAAFYDTVFQEYGIPLDTRHTYTKLDWEISIAAISDSSDTRNKMISALAKWINETPTSLPLGDLYDTTTGDYPPSVTFADRPVVGGAYAMLVAKR